MNFAEIIDTLASVCDIIKLLVLQLDVSSSQLLVTDSDFENSNFRERLRETVESLLELRVIPIFNENDAISTRKAPYEVRFVQYINRTLVFV
jgi:glutamate 5-kinase